MLCSTYIAFLDLSLRLVLLVKEVTSKNWRYGVKIEHRREFKIDKIDENSEPSRFCRILMLLSRSLIRGIHVSNIPKLN
jgi:hypothetical protein